MRLPVLLMPDATDVWARCSRPGPGLWLGGAFPFGKGLGGHGAWTQLGTVLLRKQRKLSLQRKLRPVLEQAG